jgi:hypothetical protein
VEARDGFRFSDLELLSKIDEAAAGFTQMFLIERKEILYWLCESCPLDEPVVPDLLPEFLRSFFAMKFWIL